MIRYAALTDTQRRSVPCSEIPQRSQLRLEDLIQPVNRCRLKLPKIIAWNDGAFVSVIPLVGLKFVPIAERKTSLHQSWRPKVERLDHTLKIAWKIQHHLFVTHHLFELARLTMNQVCVSFFEGTDDSILIQNVLVDGRCANDVPLTLRFFVETLFGVPPTVGEILGNQNVARITHMENALDPTHAGQVRRQVRVVANWAKAKIMIQVAADFMLVRTFFIGRIKIDLTGPRQPPKQLIQKHRTTFVQRMHQDGCRF